MDFSVKGQWIAMRDRIFFSRWPSRRKKSYWAHFGFGAIQWRDKVPKRPFVSSFSLPLAPLFLFHRRFRGRQWTDRPTNRLTDKDRQNPADMNRYARLGRSDSILLRFLMLSSLDRGFGISRSHKEVEGFDAS